MNQLSKSLVNLDESWFPAYLWKASYTSLKRSIKKSWLSTVFVFFLLIRKARLESMAYVVNQAIDEKKCNWNTKFYVCEVLHLKYISPIPMPLYTWKNPIYPFVTWSTLKVPRKVYNKQKNELIWTKLCCRRLARISVVTPLITERVSCSILLFLLFNPLTNS